MNHRFPSLMAPLECGCPSPALGLQEERERVLRQLRALEAVGSRPHGRPRLSFALVKLVELDLVLAGILARLGRGTDPMPYVVLVDRLIAIGADKRAKVLAALADDERARVAAAFVEAQVPRDEALHEVLTMRLEPGVPQMLGGIPIPLRDADARFLARTGWGTVLPWPWRV